MQESSDPGDIMTIPVGTKLRMEESSAVEELLGEFLSERGSIRDDAALAHDDLQSGIGRLLQKNGVDISYAVPFADVGLPPGTGIFDLVATMGDVLTIVEVCEDASEAALAVIDSHMTALRASNVQCKVFMAIDVMNGSALLSSALGKTVKPIMTEGDMGVILADATFMIVCSNYEQLSLEEMPEFLFMRG